MSDATQPLAGVTVVEIGTSVAAPYGTWILGCLGARVIKVEAARGDDARKWGGFSQMAGLRSLRRSMPTKRALWLICETPRNATGWNSSV